ncbi:MAG: tripartite tricarboxylate transporter TctB family protein [Spirochaetaceae bacterium]|nr:MAG: tripartite tricarboxylate transporter TctB family protein [Spirochaetaceae bacterium]
MGDKLKQDHGMPRADFFTGLVLLAFSAAVLYFSIAMPRLEHRGINPLSAPAVVPGLLGVIIGVCSLALVTRAVVRGGYRLRLSASTTKAFVTGPAVRRIGATVGICLLYAWGLVGRVHYTLATFLFVLMFVLFFELAFGQEERRSMRRTVWTATLEAALVAGIVSAVFQYLFLVALP